MNLLSYWNLAAHFPAANGLDYAPSAVGLKAHHDTTFDDIRTGVFCGVSYRLKDVFGRRMLRDAGIWDMCKGFSRSENLVFERLK